MEREYNFSGFSESELHFIAREILQTVYGYNLTQDFVHDGLRLDLVQTDSEKNSVDVLVEVKGTYEITPASAAKINKQLEKYIATFNPKKVILFCFSNINSTAYSLLFQTFEKLSFSNYEILQLDWIQEQLFKNPILDAKFDFRHVVQSSEETIESEAEKAVDFTTKMLALNNSGKNFYALGHIWGNEDQLERFLKGGTWENGHEDKLTNVVRRIKSGDIVFLQSSYSGYMRVKAIGVVADNIGDGHKIMVQWFQHNKYIDIPERGAYRSAISQIGKEIIPIILEGLYQEIPDLFDIIHDLEYGISQAAPIRSKTIDWDSNLEFIQYWWFNAPSDLWDVEKMKTGDTHLYSSGSKIENGLSIFKQLKKVI
jgi:hypothetical protein